MEEWTPGQKHPETPKKAFMNCYDQDRVRRILLGRCRICNFVISQDEKAIKEIFVSCGDPNCACTMAKSAMSHMVCSVCYDMFHSLYVNYSLKNMNYFKNLDEKEKREFEDRKKRWRNE